MCSMTGAMATGIMKRMGAHENFSGRMKWGKLNQGAAATCEKSTSKNARSAT